MQTQINLVINLEKELLSPKTRKSKTRLNELLADDFFEFMQDGNPANKLDILKSYQIVLKKLLKLAKCKLKFYLLIIFC
jgi:hypothetical protein